MQLYNAISTHSFMRLRENVAVLKQMSCNSTHFAIRLREHLVVSNLISRNSSYLSKINKLEGVGGPLEFGGSRERALPVCSVIWPCLQSLSECWVRVSGYACMTVSRFG